MTRMSVPVGWCYWLVLIFVLTRTSVSVGRCYWMVPIFVLTRMSVPVGRYYRLVPMCSDQDDQVDVIGWFPCVINQDECVSR